MSGIQPRWPSYQILLGEWGLERDCAVLLPVCLAYSSCFQYSAGPCQYGGPEHVHLDGQELSHSILNITCSLTSLTLYRSIDLVRIQWDIGVLFGVVRVLKPTHTLNNNNCRKIKVNTCWKFTMFEQLLQALLVFTTLWYKYYYYPHFTEEKTEAQP